VKEDGPDESPPFFHILGSQPSGEGQGRHNCLETLAVLRRPVSVTAEMKALGHSGSIVMSLFNPRHCRGGGLELQDGCRGVRAGTAGGGALEPREPGTPTELEAGRTSRWRTYRIDALVNDEVNYFVDGELKATHFEDKLQRGTLQFMSFGCDVAVRNVRVLWGHQMCQEPAAEEAAACEAACEGACSATGSGGSEGSTPTSACGSRGPWRVPDVLVPGELERRLQREAIEEVARRCREEVLDAMSGRLEEVLRSRRAEEEQARRGVEEELRRRLEKLEAGAGGQALASRVAAVPSPARSTASPERPEPGELPGPLFARDHNACGVASCALQ